MHLQAVSLSTSQFIRASTNQASPFKRGVMALQLPALAPCNDGATKSAWVAGVPQGLNWRGMEVNQPYNLENLLFRRVKTALKCTMAGQINGSRPILYTTVNKKRSQKMFVGQASDTPKKMLKWGPWSSHTFTQPPSAPTLLKISMKCRHIHNLRFHILSKSQRRCLRKLSLFTHFWQHLTPPSISFLALPFVMSLHTVKLQVYLNTN